MRSVSFGALAWLLASCGQQQPAPSKSAQSDIEEVRAAVDATKNSPSLKDPAKFAGPPIQVDPYPKGDKRHVQRNDHSGMNMN